MTLVELLMVIAIMGLLIAVLLPAVQLARESARRTGCINNLRQIGLALATYHDAQTVLPAAVADNWAGSKQLHSWAVFLLPYVEEGPLAEQYDFPLGWNAPENRPVVSKRLPIYLCPSSDEVYYEGDGTYAKGDYAAVSGIEPVANGGPMYSASHVQSRNILDGLSRTLLIGEVYFHNLGWARGSAAGTTGGGGGGGAAFSRGVSRWWSCLSPCARPGLNPPRTECNNHCEQRFQFSSPHEEGVYFVYCDGHVEFLLKSIDDSALRSLMTISGEDIKPVPAK